MKLLGSMVAPERGEVVEALVDDARAAYVGQQLTIGGEQYEIVLIKNDHLIVLEKLRTQIFPVGTELR